MPQKRRFRRLGSTSAAVSLGAVTLVITGAGPASAGTAKGCPEGSGPMTTLQNVPCRLEAIAGDVTDITGGVIDDIKGGTDLTGDGARPARPPEKATRPRPAPRASTPAASRAPRETPFTVVGVPALRLPRPDGKLPAAAQPDLSSLLPQPHVAAAPQPRAAAPEGQLVTPMSGTEQQNTQMLAVAVAAGLAGAVGALNLSVAGRRSRRPRT